MYAWKMYVEFRMRCSQPNKATIHKATFSNTNTVVAQQLAGQFKKKQNNLILNKVYALRACQACMGGTGLFVDGGVCIHL